MADEPLLSFVRRHLDAAGRLTDAGHTLPDETPTDSGVRWAPGALDGVSAGAGGDEVQNQVAEIARLVVKACQRPNPRRRRRLHAAVVDTDALSIVDPLIEELGRLRAPSAAVGETGLWLATTSPGRNPVKVGLALLGAAGIGEHIEIVRTLGTHDEFTLYAVTALLNGLEEPDPELWSLAQSVDGWGRIHCVTRLQDTPDPRIQSWLLREGYKNSVLYAYTALVAAETGGLLAALEGDHVDRELLTAAGDILPALIEEGPARNIDSYSDGPAAIDRYLTLMLTRAELLTDYLAVVAIREFVNDDDRFGGTRLDWPEEDCAALRTKCEQIRAQAHWPSTVAAGLAVGVSEQDFDVAARVAHDLDIDVFGAAYRRIERDPLRSSWFHAWRAADTEKARQLAELARAQLPLDAIADGPADEMGFGPEFAAHSALDWSLQALRDHPGVGGDLLLVGLQSPVTRNRYMSLTALGQWPVANWPTGARELLQAAAATDPYVGIREEAGDLLRDKA